MQDAALDPRVRRSVLPTRVVWQSGNVTNTSLLLRNNTGQAIIHGGEACVLNGIGASLLLDFGRELHGSLQLVVGPNKGYGPAKLRLRFGESVSEAMSEPLSHHSVRDFIVPMPTMASQEFGQTGFRFVRIDLLDDTRLALNACRAITLMRDLPQIGSFKCSDERLNRIWQVGADTVHLCLQDYVWDGIKRDRAVWIGDLHPEAAVVTAVWGDLPIVRDSLDWARDHTPLPQWMNTIGSYSMWWVICHCDWYMAHGNLDYLRQQRDYLVGLLPVLAEQVQEDGSVIFRGWEFLDWPSSGNKPAVHAGLIALLSMALRAGASLCDELGESAAAEAAKWTAYRLRTPDPPTDSKQASSLMALAGLELPAYVNQRVLAREPLSGLSTFYGYYVLQARAMAGDVAGALDVVRMYWGGMLDLGATSFWEDFDLAWADNAGRIDELTPPGKIDVHATYGDHCYKGLRHSLCHGWAAGPTAWLSKEVLGVWPMGPGRKTVLVRPDLGDLNWAEGTYPTPAGPVWVRHTKNAADEVKSEIQAPVGVTIVR